MKTTTLKNFVKSAPKADVDSFIREHCGGSRSQLYQLTGGHRNIAAHRVQAISKWLKSRGYNIPASRLRPDIFGSR